MKPKAAEGNPKQAAYYIKPCPIENMTVNEATSMLLVSDNKFSGGISQLPIHLECWYINTKNHKGGVKIFFGGGECKPRL